MKQHTLMLMVNWNYIGLYSVDYLGNSKKWEKSCIYFDLGS